ncbi:hypothetical protein ACLKMH_13085 [Psychromonas sp. KJ10-10]|uniref:hypothetical protein n=1 Tax=Psychromonas sp. KJ10-10 TaxID=3391823 RepID=UPI0039B69A17
MKNKLLLKSRLKNHSTKALLILSAWPFLFACTSPSVLESIDASVAEKTRTQWREKLNWPGFCDDGVSHITQYDDSFVGVEIYDWVAGKKLISVVCETGAYQQGLIFYLQNNASNASYQLINFPQFALIKDAPVDASLETKSDFGYYQYRDPLVSGNFHFDVVNGHIRVDDFYRSGGGCGISTNYSVLTEQANVISLRTKESCDEVDAKIADWQLKSKSEYSNWPKH